MTRLTRRRVVMQLLASSKQDLMRSCAARLSDANSAKTGRAGASPLPCPLWFSCPLVVALDAVTGASVRSPSETGRSF